MVVVSFFTFAFFVLLVPVATAWHRLIPLGSSDPGARVAYSFRAEEWIYVKAVVVLAVAYLVLRALFGALFAPGLTVVLELMGTSWFSALGIDVELASAAAVAVLSLIIVGVAVVRFFLVLPAAAIGRPIRVADSGAATQGNTYRLFLCLF